MRNEIEDNIAKLSEISEECVRNLYAPLSRKIMRIKFERMTTLTFKKICRMNNIRWPSRQIISLTKTKRELKTN